MSWELKRLGDFVNIRTGKLDANASSIYGSYPFFTCSREPLKISSYSYDCECVLIAGNGDLNVKYYFGKFDAYQRTYIIESKDKSVLWVRYLYNFLDKYLEKLREQSIGGVIKYIKLENITDAQIPIPPLETQKRIADILDAAYALRQKDQELLEKYDELAQAIFIDMFGDPVKNEKGWAVKRLGEITNLVTDGKHGNCNDEENSGYYFISAKDIFNGKINYFNSRQIPFHEFEEVDRRTNLQPGDVVMVNTGATIGKLAIVENIPETRRTTFQKSVAVIKLNNNYVLADFIKYVFLLRINTFSSKGTGSAVQNLLLSEMREFEIILPPIEMQKIFSSKINIILHQINICDLLNMSSLNLFNTLLQKAFKGELVS